MQNQTTTSPKLFPIRSAYGLSSHSKVAYHERALKAAATRKANKEAAIRAHNREVWSALVDEIKYGAIAITLVLALLFVVLH